MRNEWQFWVDHWQWGVEIALLALAYYGIYRLIRGTRSAAVLAGLAILLTAMWLMVNWLDMTVIGTLLVVILNSLPVLLVVLLQQEMRQGLAGLSLQNLLARDRTRSEVIEAVVGAAESLSEKRIGVLIALENSTTDQAVIESGVELNAKVSTELLETIFFPKTALHDGGVWVRRERVMAAACIFPLTQRESLHRSMGLRHRAAIGLSEATDAAVVVVSEETGTISLCYKGVVERPLDPDQLRERLTDILISRRSSR
jgi:diadenylate cyclase